MTPTMLTRAVLKQRLIQWIGALAVSTLGFTAHAVTVSTVQLLSGTISANGSAPSSREVSFDVASWLSGRGYSNYRVNSAMVWVSADSPVDYQFVGREEFYRSPAVQVGTTGTGHLFQRVVLHDIYRDSIIDSLSAQFAGGTATRAASWAHGRERFSSTTSSDTRFVCLRAVIGRCLESTLFTTQTTVEGYRINDGAGLIRLNYTLSTTDLALLATSGVLNFTLFADAGRLDLRNMEFIADISPVPLPGAALLLMTGLAPLWAARRRKQAQTAQTVSAA